MGKHNKGFAGGCKNRAWDEAEGVLHGDCGYSCDGFERECFGGEDTGQRDADDLADVVDDIQRIGGVEVADVDGVLDVAGDDGGVLGGIGRECFVDEDGGDADEGDAGPECSRVEEEGVGPLERDVAGGYAWELVETRDPHGVAGGVVGTYGEEGRDFANNGGGGVELGEVFAPTGICDEEDWRRCSCWGDAGPEWEVEFDIGGAWGWRRHADAGEVTGEVRFGVGAEDALVARVGDELCVDDFKGLPRRKHVGRDLDLEVAVRRGVVEGVAVEGAVFGEEEEGVGVAPCVHDGIGDFFEDEYELGCAVDDEGRPDAMVFNVWTEVCGIVEDADGVRGFWREVFFVDAVDDDGVGGDGNDPELAGDGDLGLAAGEDVLRVFDDGGMFPEGPWHLHVGL